MRCKLQHRKTLLMFFAVICGAFILIYKGDYIATIDHTHEVFVDPVVYFIVDKRFLSVALDTSVLKGRLFSLSEDDLELLAKLAQHLTPGFLRMGGTAADALRFDPYDSSNLSYEYSEKYPTEPFYVHGSDWLKLQKFVERTKLDFLFDLNVLLRRGRWWDETNALQLLEFSQLHSFMMHFQLGNEPNAFPHKFNVTVPARDLAADFKALQRLLSIMPPYTIAGIIGPDVTRPKHFAEDAENYLAEFLPLAKEAIQAVTWHQYYLDGKTATADNFTDSSTLSMLPAQIDAMKSVIKNVVPEMPIWLSETGSAYGGGAPGLSDRFVASFLWLDKLGAAAAGGISVVVRQSLYGGHYGLLDTDMAPLPDYWVTLLHKQLVGPLVLDTKIVAMPEKEVNLRFYAHCATTTGAIVLFGLNLNNFAERIVVRGCPALTQEYILTPENGDLLSKRVLLNGRLLTPDDIPSIKQLHKTTNESTLVMPPYSLGFWVSQIDNQTICY